MTIDDRDVQRVVEDTWQALLGIAVEVVPDGADGPSGDLSRDCSPWINASVRVGGAWAGQTRVACSLRLATMLAASMVGVPADDVDEEDTADALGELANVVTGNLKSLLPVTCELALPRVERQPVGSGTWPAAPAGGRTIRFTCLGEPLLITFDLTPTAPAVGSAP